MEKKELRQKYKEKRRQLTVEDRGIFSKLILQNFLASFPVTSQSKIHLFLTIEKHLEIQTEPFIDTLLRKGARIFVPKMDGDHLISVEITGGTVFKVNSWGIQEPESDRDAEVTDFDYVLTPLLYCDASGNRVGYGKGFYDRLFAQLDSSVKKIGLNYFLPDEPVTDVSPEDIPLDYLVTPTVVLSFSSGMSKSTK